MISNDAIRQVLAEQEADRVPYHEMWTVDARKWFVHCRIHSFVAYSLPGIRQFGFWQRSCNPATVTQGWFLDSVNGLTTTNIYDADGNRLIVTEPNGDKTLHLDGQDVLLRQGALSAYRRYTLGGELVAIRDFWNTVKWVTTNQQQTINLTIESSGNYRRQRTTPYGAPLGLANQHEPSTKRGFLAAYEDDPTGLVMLGARHYEPGNELFISADPVESGYPYAYGDWNPVLHSDGMGMSESLRPRRLQQRGIPGMNGGPSRTRFQLQSTE